LLAELEAAGAKESLRVGRSDDALKRLARLARIFRKLTTRFPAVGPLASLSKTIGVANQALRAHSSAGARAELSAALATADDPGPWLLECRYVALAMADGLKTLRAPQLLLNDAALRTFECADAQPAWYARPYSEHQSQLSREARVTLANPLDWMKAYYVVPKYQVLRRECERCRASFRCLRVFAALRERGVDARLEDLGLPPERLLDPYDGKPLRVKREPGGVTVYSIGPNLVDDGGSIGASGLDVGVGPMDP
jgi:hypothetical protein